MRTLQPPAFLSRQKSKRMAQLARSYCTGLSWPNYGARYVDGKGSAVHIIAWNFFFNSGKCFRRERRLKPGWLFPALPPKTLMLFHFSPTRRALSLTPISLACVRPVHACSLEHHVRGILSRTTQLSMTTYNAPRSIRPLPLRLPFFFPTSWVSTCRRTTRL